jgi:hypothetical protein
MIDKFLIGIIIIFVLIIIFNKTKNYRENFTDYNNLYEYDYNTFNHHNKNLINKNPYTFKMNEDQNEKIFSNNIYGFNDQIEISNDIYNEPNKINTNLLLDNVLNWNNENKPIPTLDYNDISRIVPDYNYNKTDCGGLGNICSSDYDCCKGVFCYNNKCQQI